MLEINSPRDNPDFKEQPLDSYEWLLLHQIITAIHVANLKAHDGDFEMERAIRAIDPFCGFASEDFAVWAVMSAKISHNAG